MYKDEFPEVDLFALFLREVYDIDDLLLFLLVRDSIQRNCGLQLKLKEKIAEGNANRVLPSQHSIAVLEHPKLHNGSMQVWISEAAARLVLLEVLTEDKLATFELLEFANHDILVSAAPLLYSTFRLWCDVNRCWRCRNPCRATRCG